MSFRGLMEYRGIVPGTTAPALRRARKGALKQMLVGWKRDSLPKHFTLQGFHQYGYTKRTAKYMRKKAKYKGHQRPHVYSGEAERMATQGAGRLSGTSKRARLWFRIPYYYYISRNRTIDLVDEVTHISLGELVDFGLVFETEVEKALGIVAARRQTRRF